MLTKKKSKQKRQSRASGDQVVRGHFVLGIHEHSVHVSSSADFRLYICARNGETSRGGIQIQTSPSQFRGKDSSGPQDELTLDIPTETGLGLGCIGSKGSEVIDVNTAFASRVTVFLTLVTAKGATVSMQSS